MIEIVGLSKTYRNVRALNNVSLKIQSGVFGLLGPNGAGKTTLIRILATVLAPTAGTARVFGHDVVRERLPIRRMLGYLPQEFGAYPKLTAREYLEYIAGLKELRQPQVQIEDLLARFGLKEAAHRRVTSYSGGMLRRLGIAQALLGSPKVLLVDEPTTGLDPEERVRFRDHLIRLGQERVVLLSTHIVEDVAMTCSQLAVLHRGEVRFSGKPGELVDRFAHQVYEIEVPEAQTADTLSTLGERILTTQRSEGGRIVHIQGRVAGARPVAPSLEDAYLLLLRT